MPDMRHAPPAAMRVPDRGGGLNQISVRTYNERLIMSALRQRGALSRLELGQLSGLSAQTISVIVRALERDGFILAGEAQRGRVGPPSIPMSLNPEGAFAIGLRLGLKSLDCVLIDFVGHVRQHAEMSYDHRHSQNVLDAMTQAIEGAAAAVPGGSQERLVGIGIAVPAGIDSWPRPQPGGLVTNWGDVDFEAFSQSILDIPTYIQNDVTAAASAEIIFGTARNLGDFVYFFIDRAIGSRLVLNHRIYAGRRGHSDDQAPEAFEDKTTAERLVDEIRSLLRYVDINHVIIDGRFERDACEALASHVGERLAGDLAQGGALNIICGDTGGLAKAIGAASLAFHSRFMVDEVGLAQN